MQQELIGRERERAQLDAWVTEAMAGHGSLVLLAGEAGVGKTTLAKNTLSRSGLETLEGFAVQGGTSPFPVTQQNGAVTAIPEFLDSQHQIAGKADAEAYLARVEAMARLLDQETA